MPWQSLVNFKPSASKRKEQQPVAHAPDAVNSQLPDPYNVHAYAPTPLSTANSLPTPTPEHHVKRTTFAPDAFPSR